MRAHRLLTVYSSGIVDAPFLTLCISSSDTRLYDLRHSRGQYKSYDTKGRIYVSHVAENNIRAGQSKHLDLNFSHRG